MPLDKTCYKNISDSPFNSSFGRHIFRSYQYFFYCLRFELLLSLSSETYFELFSSCASYMQDTFASCKQWLLRNSWNYAMIFLNFNASFSDIILHQKWMSLFDIFAWSSIFGIDIVKFCKMVNRFLSHFRSDRLSFANVKKKIRNQFEKQSNHVCLEYIYHRFSSRLSSRFSIHSYTFWGMRMSGMSSMLEECHLKS